MRIVYLSSATGGLRWLRSYYGQVSPEEATKAREAVRGMERLVLDNPFIGAPCTAPKCADADRPQPVLCPLPPTPERVEILRVLDGRRLDGMVEERRQAFSWAIHLRPEILNALRRRTHLLPSSRSSQSPKARTALSFDGFLLATSQ